MNKKGKLFIISAPSGTGKTTLVKEILRRISDKYKIKRVVTYTSRATRPSEKDGVDYHFISPGEFAKKSDDGLFLESTSYANKIYASPASVLEDLKLGESRILVIDREGAKTVRGLPCNPVTIWVAPPSIDSLKNRLSKRITEPHSKIEERLNIAKQEMEDEQKQRVFKYHVVNEVFDQAASELQKIIEEELNKD